MREFLEISTETIQRFGEDCVEATRLRIDDKPLIFGSEACCATDGSIGIRVDDVPAFLISPNGTDTDLIFDRGVGLFVGGKPCVYGDLHGPDSEVTLADHRGQLVSEVLRLPPDSILKLCVATHEYNASWLMQMTCAARPPLP